MEEQEVADVNAADLMENAPSEALSELSFDADDLVESTIKFSNRLQLKYAYC